MKQKLWILLLFLYSVSVVAQNSELAGIITDSETGQPLSGVKISLKLQDAKGTTDSEGRFILKNLKQGSDEIIVHPASFPPMSVKIVLEKNKKKIAGKIGYTFPKNMNAEETNDTYVFSETQIEEDNNSRQNISVLEGEADDVYLKTARFSFSPMRFNFRGYNQENSATYINGVNFNDGERGRFNYSMLGGLNNAMRSKDIITGTRANSFTYGSLGSNTNINTNASNFSAGTKTNVALTNRSYKLRAQATYATGLMANGWAVAASAVVRWADEGLVEGTFYNSAGYFFSAEKVFNRRHSLSFTTFGAPTQRAQSGAVTQEVYDLKNSIYYNPYWGYQDGKKRNSRIVKSFDPTAILAHDFKISETQKLHTGVAFHYSMYNSSALGFYNATDPRPDYYRMLPSFQTDAPVRDQLTQLWENDPNASQINWPSLYQSNLKNNIIDPTGSAKYVIEERHNNLMEVTFNSIYNNKLTKNLKVTAGVEAKYSKGMHYKTLGDLLGGKQWIDVDQFAERDFPSNTNISQNDLRNPNAVVNEGGIFGYNYDMNVLHGNAFLQNEWTSSHLDVYYAGKATYSQFYRFGHMDNGRALQAIYKDGGTKPEEQSYGKGKTWYFVDPSVKIGATIKIDGRNRFSVNAIAETRAPLASNSYISQRIKDTKIPNLQSEKILSYDASYAFSYPMIKGRVSAFRTHILGNSELFGYYDDEFRTFVNQVLTKSNKLHQGVEAGVAIKLNGNFSLSLAGTYADYRYTNDAVGIKNFENGSYRDTQETIKTKDLKESTGPQLAGSVTLNFFSSTMWFADISANYFDNNYLDFAPNRFSEANLAKYTTDEAKLALGTQEKLKGGMMMNASLGKLIYLSGGRSMNINLSISNLTNNTKMITGGYMQARLPLDGTAIDQTAINRFPSKYYYAWGANAFLNLGYKF